MQLKTNSQTAHCNPRLWIRRESCRYPLPPLVPSHHSFVSAQAGPPQKANPSFHPHNDAHFFPQLLWPPLPLPLLLSTDHLISFFLVLPLGSPLVFCFCHSMSQSSPFFSIARAHAGAGGRAAAAALLLRCPAAQLPPTIHYFRLAKVSPAKTLNSHLVLPRATLSSFANADDGSSAKSDASEEQNGGSELSEMAKAFHISPRMAMSISVVIAFAALTVPLAMRSLVFHGTIKMKVLAYLTLLSGFYMAWNIGANDVANAMGTSVGSGALTLRQAVLTAAVLEFSGAFLMGTHVTSTMQKGILVTSVFQGNDSLLFAGLLSSLAAAGTWLQVTFHHR